ncbi:hypothetical protein GGX14DRAFT_210022 [Mycena pura]|uniref:Uncharacterized protein n=1 Tax=Mycena pura TaxID=153505 RepID=A0AAD6UTF3_9AGAR|nr:hypothetical protein GGX14DRAFT_210022 [Mycena pura]
MVRSLFAASRAPHVRPAVHAALVCLNRRHPHSAQLPQHAARPCIAEDASATVDAARLPQLADSRKLHAPARPKVDEGLDERRGGICSLFEGEFSFRFLTSFSYCLPFFSFLFLQLHGFLCSTNVPTGRRRLSVDKIFHRALAVTPYYYTASRNQLKLTLTLELQSNDL